MLLIVPTTIPDFFGEVKIRLSMPPRRQPRAEVPTCARSRARSIERERPCARPSEPATSPLRRARCSEDDASENAWEIQVLSCTTRVSAPRPRAQTDRSART